MKEGPVREYRSPLRDDQAEATAKRILDAAMRVLERNPGSLAIPAVAREAGVAVPTVYHHFGDKAGLIRALSDHLDRAAFGDYPGDPTNVPELAAHVRYAVPRLHGRHALMAPALRSAEGSAFRREQIAARAAMVRHSLATAEPRFDAGEFDKLAAIVTVLCTTETLGLLEEYLGLTAEEAAEAVAWAITQLAKE